MRRVRRVAAEPAINQITAEHNGGTKNHCNYTAIDNDVRGRSRWRTSARYNVTLYICDVICGW